MIVNYPMRGEKVSEKGTRHPNEELGGANRFPEKQESIQTYPREAGMEHPDETVQEESNPVDRPWPVKENVKEYPRHAD
jgi:hypothetical protein